jgi:hypothetical protein
MHISLKRLINLFIVIFILLGFKNSFSENPYILRFFAQYNKIHNSANGYFSKEGVPYHSIETMIIEAPDYGHETTSEAFSYFVWLEAMYGKLTGDFSRVNDAWQKLEHYAIPTHEMQPTNSFYYSSDKPATFVAEFELPEKYPAPLDFGVPVGKDPIKAELKQAYGTEDIYAMHWLFDVDNWYGYGNLGDGTSRVSYINTFQRGPQESVWETFPHPSWEAFKWGGKNGFLDLFTLDASYAKQWRYTNAPDADARAIQALYLAYLAAKEKAKEGEIPNQKAAKLGDYVRYCFFDKYFKKLGCRNKYDAGAEEYQSAHYLISWYFAWGGAIDNASGWAWRIGSSHCHFGYQNPVAAWILSTEPAFSPKSTNGKSDWAKSLKRQLEFYKWLQSEEGAIAGGCSNSWNGRYEEPPQGTSTFYGMAYQPHPVYNDPGSNQWFGWQAWSMQRVAEYFYYTNDSDAKSILDLWVSWIKKVVLFPTETTYQIPATLEWTGQPEIWNPQSPLKNINLHVKIKDYTTDIGVSASLARALMYYSAGLKKLTGKEDAEAKEIAQKILDRMWLNYEDEKGIAAAELRGDYKRLYDPIPMPSSGWNGVMPNGDQIKPGVTFLDIRSKYKNDPDFERVDAAIKSGKEPEFKYHRFWAQVEVALAHADWATLFPFDTIQTQKIFVYANKNAYQKNQQISLNVIVKNGYIYIKIPNQGFIFNLISINGKKILSYNFINNAKISTNNITNGSYIINLKTKGSIINKKIFIKN